MEGVEGNLIIKWELISYKGLATEGCGVWRRKNGSEVFDVTVWFKVTGFMDQKNNNVNFTDNLVYNLYDLDEESWNIVNKDHELFKKTVGLTKEYGEDFRTDFNDSSKSRVVFVQGYKESDLHMKFIGKMNYNQLLNPFPYMIL